MLFYLFRHPSTLGRYSLSIKYDDQHVRGSPFNFNVCSAPDASKVRAHGSFRSFFLFLIIELLAKQYANLQDPASIMVYWQSELRR